MKNIFVKLILCCYCARAISKNQFFEGIFSVDDEKLAMRLLDSSCRTRTFVQPLLKEAIKG